MEYKQTSVSWLPFAAAAKDNNAFSKFCIPLRTLSVLAAILYIYIYKWQYAYLPYNGTSL